MALCLAKEQSNVIKIVGEQLVLEEVSCPFGYLDRSQLYIASR